MLFKDDNDKPPTSKEEAYARRKRPPPEEYDPDSRSHWSITMVVAWIIWREIDAVRNEWDDYRNECYDWLFEKTLSERLTERIATNDKTGLAQSNPGLQKKLQEKLEELEKLEKEPSWHLHQWKPSGWKGLRSRAQNRRPQVAINSLWREAGESGIKATALQCKNAKTFDGDLIEIPAHYWPRLKCVDDPLSGKAMLSDDQGRVYRDVQFRRLNGKKIWPKSPPLSGELPEPPEPERVEAQGPTKPAERKSLKPKARPTPERPQSERAKRYIKKHYPNGTDGVSTTTIHRKFTKDKDLEAELEKEEKEGGTWGVPSEAVINRVLGRRK